MLRKSTIVYKPPVCTLCRKVIGVGEYYHETRKHIFIVHKNCLERLTSWINGKEVSDESQVS